MASNPAEPRAIPIVPTAALFLVPEHIRLRGIRTHIHRDVPQRRPSVAVKALHGAAGREQAVVFLPHGRHIPLATGVADGDVGEDPIPVPRPQGLGEKQEEGVIRLATDDVVAQGALSAEGGEGGKVEDRVKIQLTALEYSIALFSRRGNPPGKMTRRESQDKRFGESTHIIEIYVDASEVSQSEIADHVDALDGISVTIVRVEEPGKFGRDEVPRRLGGP